MDSRRPLGAGKILGAVETLALGLTSDAGFRIYDRLYVTPPAGHAFSRGDRYVVVAAVADIPDVGRVVEPRGIIRIDSVPAGSPAIGTLVKQFGTIAPEALVLPEAAQFEPTTERPARGGYAETSNVLWIQSSPTLPSVQTYVVLSAPRDGYAAPGDEFTLYYDAPAAAIAHTAPIASATVKIVRVTPLGVSGLIVDQTQPQVSVGMPARLTAKMPR